MARSDEELIAEARKGHLWAFDELVGRHQERVFALAYRMLGSAEDAADVQQETFVRAWQNLKAFRGQAAITTWLHRITVNTCISRKRRKCASEVPIEFDADWQLGGGDTAVACLERTELATTVRAAVAALPAHYRALVVLRDMEGRSCGEIAQIVGGTEGSVRTRLHRARALLRDRLRPYVEEEAA